MKKAITILAFGLSVSIASQVGIGTASPDQSAALHVESSNKGILFPRTILQSSTDSSTILSPAKGLIVYHIAPTINGTGLYVNMGTNVSPQWIKLDYYTEPPYLNVNKLIYSGTTNDNTKILITPLYEWRLFKVTTTTYSVQARLRSVPLSTVNLNGSIKFWTFNDSVANSVNISWTTSDWNTWKNIYVYNTNWDSIMFIRASNDPTKFYKFSAHVELDNYNLLVMEIF